MKKLFSFLAIATFFTLSLLRPTPTRAINGFTLDTTNTLTQSLSHFWKFDESGNPCGNPAAGYFDSTPGPNPRTIGGCGGFGTRTTGKLNNGIGVTTSPPNGAILTGCIAQEPGFCRSTNWTLAAWVKPATLPQTGVILSDGDQANYAGWGGMASFGIANGTTACRGTYDSFLFQSGTRLTGLFIAPNGGAMTFNASTCQSITLDGGFDFAVNGGTSTWHHVVMTNDGQYTRFYVDGYQTAAYGVNPQAIDPTWGAIGAMHFYNQSGCNNDLCNSNLFSGTIDEVIGWYRALSAQNVADLYNAGFGNPYDVTNAPSNLAVTGTLQGASLGPNDLNGTQYTIILSTQGNTGTTTTGITPGGASFTGFGGYNIGNQYAMINYNGGAGKYRGYVGWSMQNFFYWNDFAQGLIPCAGGGQAGVRDAYGSQYISLINCTTSVTSNNNRTTTFTVTFNNNFNFPTGANANSIWGFARNFNGQDVTGGWTQLGTFTLSPTLTCSPPNSLVSWWDMNEASGSAVADSYGTNFGTATNPNPSFTNSGLNSGLTGYWNLDTNSKVNSSVESPPTLPNNLRSYWALEENVGQGATGIIDQGPANLTLTVSPGACSPRFDASGKIGSDYRFNMAADGLSTCNSILYTGANSVSSTTNWTLSAWIKPENTSQPTGPLIHNGTIGTGYGFGMSGNQLIGYINNVSFATGKTLDTNWHHVVMTRDTTMTYLYLDGVLAGLNNALTPTNPDAYFILGGYGGFGYFQGRIDEVATWNRYFPSTDVTALFNSNTGCGFSPTSPSLPTTALSGKSPAAQSFTSNYINVSCFNAPNVTTNISMTAWIYPTALPTFGTIIAKRNLTTNATDYAFRTQGNRLGFYYKDGAGNWRPSTISSGPTTLAINTWYHVAVTYDGSTIKFYINGSLDSTISCTWAPYCGLVPNSAPLGIGGWSGNEFFSGIIDEVGIWNRVLSGGTPGSEISQLASGDIYQSANTLNQTFNSPGLNTGLVSYWGLDDPANSVTATDSAAGNAGTFSGTTFVTPTSTPPSKNINARSFNGVSSYINIPDSNGLNITGSKLTVSTWVNFSSIAATQHILEKGIAGSTAQYYLWWGKNWSGCPGGSANSCVVAGYWDGAAWRDYKYNFTPTTGTWYHLAWTLDGSNSIIYVNGNPSSTAQTGSLVSHAGGSLHLGSNRNNGQFLNGAIDEVGIWNRALLGPEITQLYGGGNGDFLRSIRTSSRAATGAISPFSPSLGALGNARSFNGTNNYVSSGNASSLNFGSGNFTVEAWIKTNTSQRRTIIGKMDNAGTGAGYLLDVLANGLLRIVAQTNSSNYIYVDSSVPVNDNAWHHVAGVRNGATVQTYIDGVNRSGTQVTGGTLGLTDNALSLGIGYPSFSGSTYWLGLIDEVRVYNSALQQSDIQAEYQRTVSSSSENCTPCAGASCGLGSRTCTGTEPYCSVISGPQTCVVPGPSGGGDFQGYVMNAPATPVKVCAVDQNTGSGSFGTICTDSQGQPGTPAAPYSYHLSLPGLLPGPTKYDFSIHSSSIPGGFSVAPDSAPGTVTCGGSSDAPTLWFLSDAGVVAGKPANAGANGAGFSQSGTTVPPGYNMNSYTSLAPTGNVNYNYLLTTVLKNAGIGGASQANQTCFTSGIVGKAQTYTSNGKTFDLYCYSDNFNAQLQQALSSTANFQILYPYNISAGTQTITSPVPALANGKNIIAFINGSLQVNITTGSPVGISIPNTNYNASAVFVMNNPSGQNGDLLVQSTVVELDGLYIFPGTFNDSYDAPGGVNRLLTGYGSLINTGSSAWTLFRTVPVATGPGEKWTYQPKYLYIYNNILSSAKYSWSELPPQ